MSRYPMKTTAAITLSAVLSIFVSNPTKAITYRFDWTGQVAGFRVEGLFSYDKNQGDLDDDGIIRTNELDYLEVSFFGPDGTFLTTYTDNHLDAGVNFNFDPNTEEILQAGSWPDQDGINIGDGSRSNGLTFWSKPPTSGTPHVHVDDWLDTYGYPHAFAGSLSGDGHQDVAFPTRTTMQLMDDFNPGILPAYSPPNAPVTSPDETGQFAQVALVPEPNALVALLSLGGGFLTSTLFRRKPKQTSSQ